MIIIPSNPLAISAKLLSLQQKVPPCLGLQERIRLEWGSDWNWSGGRGGLLGIFAGLFGCPLTGKVKVVCYSLILLVFARATPPFLPLLLVAFVLFRWEVAQLLLLIISCSVCWFCPNTLCSCCLNSLLPLQLLSLVLCILWLHYFRWCLFLAVCIWQMTFLALCNWQLAATQPTCRTRATVPLAFFLCALTVRPSLCLSVCLSLSLSVCSSAFCELFAFACAISKGNLNYFQSYCSCLQSLAFFFMLALVICPALTSDTCSD